MGTTVDAVTGTINKTVDNICTIRPQNRTHLKQTTAVRVIVNLRMVTTIVTSTTHRISAGPVRP
jgi:hypothetical protein